MKCFYHNDLDGKCSAFWVQQKENMNSEDLIECDYGARKADLSCVKKDEKVWIVDYSIDPNDMEKLSKITKKVVWIDHHITAIDKYNNFSFKIPGLRVNGVAACELTWHYINFPKSEFSKINLKKLLFLHG